MTKFVCQICGAKVEAIYTLGGKDYCEQCARETDYAELYEGWSSKEADEE